MEEVTKPKVLHQKFDVKNVGHLAIITLAAVPLTSILIILFVIAFARLKAAFNLPIF